MSKLQKNLDPKRISKLSENSNLNQAQSNEFLLNFIAGLRSSDAKVALHKTPSSWSYSLINNMVSAYQQQLPSMSAPSAPVSESESVGPNVDAPSQGASSSPSPSQNVNVTPNVDTPATSLEEPTTVTNGTQEVTAPELPTTETTGPVDGTPQVSGPNQAPQITSVWTRSTMPMFDETADIYFNASDADWDPLAWDFNISGAHTEIGTDPGPTPWIKVSVNIPETGMVGGDQFKVEATVRDPAGATDTDSIDMEVDGLQMRTWEVLFDNQDAQVSESVDLIGDRLREEAATRSSDPLIFDLDMDGLLGTTTGDNMSNGVIDGETVLFDIDPTRSSWGFVSSSDVPGRDAPSIPNGYVVYSSGETENIGGNGSWAPQEQGGNYIHAAAKLYSSGNDLVGEWTRVEGSQYDYRWGNRMDVEMTEWLKQGSGDGFLVWDFNGNGVIDDNTEMMSEYDTNGEFAFANGYEKLRHYFDKDGDGIVKGSELDGLMFWVDSNADAQTDAGELRTLSEYGITQIDLPENGVLDSEATIGAVNDHFSSDQAQFENS